MQQKNRTQKDTERTVMEKSLNASSRNNDGRYEVPISWIEDHPLLPNNYALARKRLDSLVKKLILDGYDRYREVSKEWLDEGIIEEVPESELLKEGHYLPHRHVVKENSTNTKIRPMFHASAGQKNHPSLN